MKESKNAYDTEHPLHTFSVGLPGSPDLVAARRVAAFLGTQHHEFTFTVEEGIDALYDLIWHIESYEQVRPTAHSRICFCVHVFTGNNVLLMHSRCKPLWVQS